MRPSRLLSVAALALLVGCEASVPLAVTDPRSAALRVVADVSSVSAATVVVEVTAADIPGPLAFNLPIVNGVATGTIDVPVGVDRTIAVHVFDPNGTETHTGSVIVDVTAGVNPTVTITLGGVTGRVPIVVRIGSFIVSVTPAAATLAVGDSIRLNASIVDATGGAVVATARWATLAPGIVSVDTAGLVTARAVGTATVVATFQGVGDGAVITVTGPAPVGTGFIALHAGGGTGSGGGADFTCGITADHQAWCWGENTFGELGSAGPNSAAPRPVREGLLFGSLSVGGIHACGFTDADALYCWGYNTYGQVGDGTRTNRFAPVAVAPGLDLVSVSAGGFTTCGLSAAGAGYCWGWGALGERGEGILSEVGLQPVRVSTTETFVTLGVGAYHACALTGDGTAWCWGNNGQGQLGTTAADNTCSPGPCQSIPTPVITATRFTTVDPGGLWGPAGHTCALAYDGAAWCWGANTYGQLGDGGFLNRTQPARVSGGNAFTQISTLGEFACGVTPAGVALCWGRNEFGQLGNGTTGNSSVPVPVAGGHRFTSVSVGSHHACGLTETGEAWCWGRNTEGALGDGSFENSARPVQVIGAS